MKTKFFKKLSLVLAVAMVLSVFGPAAGAFAATKVKLNSTKKYLHLDVDKLDEYNFNIKSEKGKGWKYYWESSNENVAVVNEKNGVATATGVGTAKISLTITDKDGEEVGSAKATVVVRDNIKTVKVSNPVEKLAVNEEKDFNRSFVTVSGNTKKTSAITRWTVSPAEGATIDDKGVFVATVAGNYEVTATSFQSKAKYADWLEDSVKYADYALASDTIKITVNASMTALDQLSLNKVNATFDSAMIDVKDNIRLYRVIGSTRVLQSLKDVKMSADNKVATLESYVNFVEGETYVVEYEGLEGLSFVAAKIEAAAVTRMEILTKTVMSGRSTLIDVALYNADGVNIADNILKSRVTISTSNDATWAEGRSLMMYNVGDTTTITATYNTYNYDELGNQLGNVTATGVVTCVQYAETNVTGIAAYTITDSGADFVNVNHTIAALDENYNLFVKFDAKDINGNGITVYSDILGVNGFTFESSNNNVLIVGPYGDLSPVTAGNATVIVKHNDTVVGTVPVTVSPRRVLGSVSLDTYSFILSNSTDVNDVKTVTATVKDQLGRNMDPAWYNVETWTTSQTDGSLVANAVPGAAGSIWNNAVVNFDGTGATPGTYAFAVKITDNRVWTSMTLHITVQVKQPDGVNTSYRVETSSKTYDMAVVDYDSVMDAKISVFGYDKDGVRNERINVASSGAMKVEVTRNGSPVAFDIDNFDGVISLIFTDGAEVKKMQQGTYSIKLLELVNGNYVQKHSTYFTAKDTQVKPVVSVKKTYSATGKAVTDVLAGVQACFAISHNGYDKTSEIYDVQYTGSLSTGQIFVKSVKWKQNVSDRPGSYLVHTIDINRTITLDDAN